MLAMGAEGWKENVEGIGNEFSSCQIDPKGSKECSEPAICLGCGDAHNEVMLKKDLKQLQVYS